MKKTKLLLAALAVWGATHTQLANAAEETTTKAGTTTAAPTDATGVTTTTAPKPPSYFLTYSYYKYDLQGTNAADTRIYKFDASTVDLHMVTATWLYSPKWTLFAFVPYIKNMVETIYEPTPAGANVKTRDYTEGLGDIRLMGMTPLVADGTNLLLADISVTLPTGSVNEYFTSVPSQRAAYNMQLGSGTPDLILGTTYSYTVSKLENSARAQATVRGGRNENGWALGNELVLGVGSRYHFTKYFEAGVAGNYKARDAVQGRDDKYELHNDYGSASDPSFDPAIHGDGHQYYHAPQINWDTEIVAKVTSPSFYGVNAALEGGVSFYRDAINKDDIRLDMPYWASASVTGSF